MEELNYNLLFRWFVGLNMDDPVWHPTTFTKNRDRLLSGDVAAAFFDAVQAHARAAGLLSDEHFTVDGTQRRATRPRTRAIPRSTSTGSGGAMTPISRRPIPRRCCIGRAQARKPRWRISAMCCWTIDRGLSPRCLCRVAVDSPRRYTGAMNATDERACGKPGCDNFGKPGLNIVGHGWFVTKSGRRRRYRCTVCGGTLSTNTGTAYRGLRCTSSSCGATTISFGRTGR